jgi:uncharacterized cupin superfamily protein
MAAKFSSAGIAEVALSAAPIRPDWILEGTPQARSAELSRSADGTAMTAVWDCTAGAFKWFFGGDETVHILDGQVTVEVDGERRTLRQGDVAFFPAGTWSRWEIDTYLKKLAFCRDPLPRAVVTAIEGMRRLKRGLRGGAAAPGGLDSASA